MSAGGQGSEGGASSSPTGSTASSASSASSASTASSASSASSVATADGRTRGGYGVLLGLVLLSVLVPLVVPAEVIGMATSIVLQGLTVVVAVRVTSVPRRVRRIVLAMVGVAFALTVVAGSLLIATEAGTELLVTTARVLALVLAIVVPVLIVRDVLARPAITMQTVAAVLCVYLLLGLGFAFVHGIADAVVPGSYSTRLDATDAVYLSYVTMTTVGFGDVTPVGGLARAVTVLEAILGQLYLVSVVALIVGNVGRIRPAVQHEPPPEDA